MSKLLYVEDNADNVYMLTHRLERKGYQVIVAGDGAEAIELARQETPALILMDLSLPVMDGWEATRRLKADGTTQSIPIVALSAHAMAEDRERALAAGCDAYETKPVNFPQLLETITRLLDKDETA